MVLLSPQLSIYHHTIRKYEERKYIHEILQGIVFRGHVCSGILG